MPPTHLERMIQLAEDVFHVRNDPEQLNVDQEVLDRLHLMHPSTVSQFDDGNGPVAWVLVIPTTIELMHLFLDHKISEKGLFERTPLGISYEALYLCSALVLDEYRRKGIAKRMTLQAITDIRKDHPIKALFAWPFSDEGNLALQALEKYLDLPIKVRGKE